MKLRKFESYCRSQKLFLSFQDDSTVSVAREEKEKPASSGTLDPIGGGNLVRIVDPEVDEEFMRALFLNNQVKFRFRQNRYW